MKSNYKLGELIRNIDVKNKDLHCNNLKGLSMAKEFRASTSNIVGTDLSKYKIVAYKQFACDFMSAIRVHKMPIAFNSEMEEILVSPAYAVFEVIDENIILPEYLMMWFRRSEFDRYADFRSDAAIRGGYGWNELCETEIKLPSLEEQRKIVQAYKTITDRIELKKEINDNLEATMQAIYKNYFIDFKPFENEPKQSTKLGEIPASWQLCKFSDLCELLNGRAYSQEELLSSGKYRVLRVGNFFTKNSWYYSNMELEDNKYCYPDDLLFCWSASFGLYIWNDVKTIYHYHIWKVDFSKTSLLYREYIYLYLKQEVEKLSKEGHGSVMAHLTKNGVENLDVISPPIDIIEEFHNTILPFIEHKKLLEKEIQQLTELQDTYLSRLAN